MMSYSIIWLKDSLKKTRMDVSINLRNLFRDYFRVNKYHLFVLIVVSDLIILWLSKSLLIDGDIFYNTYSEQLSYERSLSLFNDLKRISWIGYIITPIGMVIKFAVISSVLYIGAFFCDLHDEISFRDIFGVVVASEAVFIIANISKFLWFYFSDGNYDLNDIGFFYPLSLSNLFKYSEVDKIWIFPLQVLNFFQFIYILLLSYGLYLQTGIRKSSAEKIVLISYLPGLIIWLAFIMFLSIDTSL
jgi:hypothetical protein